VVGRPSPGLYFQFLMGCTPLLELENSYLDYFKNLYIILFWNWKTTRKTRLKLSTFLRLGKLFGKTQSNIRPAIPFSTRRTFCDMATTLNCFGGEKVAEMLSVAKTSRILLKLICPEEVVP